MAHANHPSILILDDNLPMLDLYARELKDEFQVVTCISVQEACSVISMRDLAVIVLEPAVEGDEGWRIMKELEKGHLKTPVVVCSIEDEYKASMAMGARAFLVKPVLPSELRALLNQVLAG